MNDKEESKKTSRRRRTVHGQPTSSADWFSASLLSARSSRRPGRQSSQGERQLGHDFIREAMQAVTSSDKGPSRHEGSVVNRRKSLSSPSLLTNDKRQVSHEANHAPLLPPHPIPHNSRLLSESQRRRSRRKIERAQQQDPNPQPAPSSLHQHRRLPRSQPCLLLANGSGDKSIIGSYQLQSVIGSGNFSQVKLARHTLTQDLVAIKILDKTRMNAATQRLLFREISILDSLHHPNIVRLYEVMESLSKLNIVLEYVGGGDLSHQVQKTGRFEEAPAKIIIAQIVAALNHMHERNIVHRDLKADNILFTNRIIEHRPTLASLTGTNHRTANANFDQRSRKRKSGGGGVASKLNQSRLARWVRSRSRERQQSGSRDRRSTSREGQRSSRSVTPSSSQVHRRGRGGSKSGDRSDLEEITTDQEEESCETLNPDIYRVKLADFGFSKRTTDSGQLLTTFCGSPAYAAPELFSKSSYIGQPVDMWALGIVLFFTITGILPYRGPTVGHVRRVVLQGNGIPPPRTWSESAVQLYHQLTNRDPDRRPLARHLIDQSGLSTSQGHPNNCWLQGQIFPKSLPRFRRCPPSLTSYRSKSRPVPIAQPIDQPNHDGCQLATVTDQQSTTQQSQLPVIPEGHVNVVVNDDNRVNNVATIYLPEERAKEEVVIDPICRRGRKASSIDSVSCDTGSNTSHVDWRRCSRAEYEAARRLLNLGMTKEELVAARGLEARSGVTGAYRIMLHRVHKMRRMSNFDVARSSPSLAHASKVKDVKSQLPASKSFNDQPSNDPGQYTARSRNDRQNDQQARPIKSRTRSIPRSKSKDAIKLLRPCQIL